MRGVAGVDGLAFWSRSAPKSRRGVGGGIESFGGVMWGGARKRASSHKMFLLLEREWEAARKQCLFFQPLRGVCP